MCCDSVGVSLSPCKNENLPWSMRYGGEQNCRSWRISLFVRAWIDLDRKLIACMVFSSQSTRSSTLALDFRRPASILLIYVIMGSSIVTMEYVVFTPRSVVIALSAGSLPHPNFQSTALTLLLSFILSIKNKQSQL